MEKTIHIEGMSCKHCTATVEKVLSEVKGVINVSVSLEDKKASFTLGDEAVPDAKLKEAVEEAGYKVTGIR